MVLCFDEKYLVCSHPDGMITIVNTEDMSFESAPMLEELHGKIDHIGGITKIVNECVVLFEKLVFITNNGVYTGNLTNDGTLQVDEDAHFVGCNVSNIEQLQEDIMFCTLNENDKDHTSKLMTVNIETGETDIVRDQKEELYSFDLERVPGTDDHPYFILHNQSGLYLVDPLNKKMYVLRADANEQFNTCKSVALALVDDEDPSREFWLANIDNAVPNSPTITCYDFNTQFL